MAHRDRRKKRRKNRGCGMRAFGTLIFVVLVFTVLGFGVTKLQSIVSLDSLKGLFAEEQPEQTLPLNPYDAHDFYQTEAGWLEYTGAETWMGIDVSSHQGEIDWYAVKSAGVDFAVIRVGYRGYVDGIIYEDERFVSNMEGALDAGLDVGVYFFSQAVTREEAEEEAAFVLERISGYPISYPVAFDWEAVEAAARTDTVDGETLTQCAEVFCHKVQRAGYTPCLYFNEDLGYTQFDLYRLQDYEFWLASYLSALDFTYEVQMWQYSEQGSVPGISGKVDLNISFFNYGL